MIATATLTSKGQVTVPVKVRRRFDMKEGDELVFIEENGRLYVENAVSLAFARVQDAFAGEAERAGLASEDDVADMVRAIRHERGKAAHEGDA